MKQILFSLLALGFSLNAAAAQPLAEQVYRKPVKDLKAAILELYKAEMKKPNSPVRVAIDDMAKENSFPEYGQVQQPALKDVTQIGSSHVNIDIYSEYMLGVPVHYAGTAGEESYMTLIRVQVAEENKLTAHDHQLVKTTITFDSFGELKWKDRN